MPRITRIAVWGIVAVFSAGCFPGPAAHGRSFNEARKTRKIPIIPEHWKEMGRVRDADWSDAHWSDPTLASSEAPSNPMHASKYVVIDAHGNLLQECDCYWSGRKYPSGLEPNRSNPECLTIRYDFGAERMGKNPWRCEISCGPHYRDTPPQLAGQVTLDEAEAILKEWGLSRLNY
jgi:hypothetical protein